MKKQEVEDVIDVDATMLTYGAKGAGESSFYCHACVNEARQRLGSMFAEETVLETIHDAVSAIVDEKVS